MSPGSRTTKTTLVQHSNEWRYRNVRERSWPVRAEGGHNNAIGGGQWTANGGRNSREWPPYNGLGRVDLWCKEREWEEQSGRVWENRRLVSSSSSLVRAKRSFVVPLRLLGPGENERLIDGQPLINRANKQINREVPVTVFSRHHPIVPPPPTTVVHHPIHRQPHFGRQQQLQQRPAEQQHYWLIRDDRPQQDRQQTQLPRGPPPPPPLPPTRRPPMPTGDGGGERGHGPRQQKDRKSEGAQRRRQSDEGMWSNGTNWETRTEELEETKTVEEKEEEDKLEEEKEKEKEEERKEEEEKPPQEVFDLDHGFRIRVPAKCYGEKDFKVAIDQMRVLHLDGEHVDTNADGSLTIRKISRCWKVSDDVELGSVRAYLAGDGHVEIVGEMMNARAEKGAARTPPPAPSPSVPPPGELPLGTDEMTPMAPAKKPPVPLPPPPPPPSGRFGEHEDTMLMGLLPPPKMPPFRAESSL